MFRDRMEKERSQKAVRLLRDMSPDESKGEEEIRFSGKMT